MVDRRHRTDLDQLGDDVARRNDHRSRKFLHRQQVGNLDRLERARAAAAADASPFFLRCRSFSSSSSFSRSFLAAALSSCVRTRSPGAAAGRRRRRFGRGVAPGRPGRASPGPIARNGPLPPGRRAGRYRPGDRQRAAGLVLPCRLDRGGLPQAAAPRRDARKAGLRARGSRSRRRRRRGLTNDRRLTRRHRTQLRNRLGRAWRGSGGTARRRSRLGAARLRPPCGAAGAGAARTRASCRLPDAAARPALRALGFGLRRLGAAGGRRGRGWLRRLRPWLGRRLIGGLKHAANQIRDLVRDDAKLIFCLEDAAQALVEQRRQLFRGEPDLFGELEYPYFSGQVHSRTRCARVPSVECAEPQPTAWLR